MWREKVRILHTSDVHLDNRINGHNDESAAQIGLRRVVDEAVNHSVDLVLIAGDLFDHNRVKQPALDFTNEQLGRLHCPVVLITGNHDCFASYSIYHKYDPTAYDADVHFMRDDAGDAVRFEELGLTVWGRGIVEHDPDNRPLFDVPGRTNDEWYLGMAHGYYVPRGAKAYSSLITAEEIAATEFDYLALGHVHVYTEIEHEGTRAAYPGSPNKDQGAKDMTAALVDLDPGKGVGISPIKLD